MEIDKLQLLHIAAGKELRIFRNSIKHAESNDEAAYMASDKDTKEKFSVQAETYRRVAAECMEKYQSLMEQILILSNSFLLWPA